MVLQWFEYEQYTFKSISEAGVLEQDILTWVNKIVEAYVCFLFVCRATFLYV